MESIEIDRKGGFLRHIGGYPDRAKYDPDLSMIVRSNGIYDQLPLNERATAWMREHSVAAKRGNFWRTSPLEVIVGDVVFIGEQALGGGENMIVDVPDRLVEHMRAQTPERVIESLSRRMEAIQAEYGRLQAREAQKRERGADRRPERGPSRLMRRDRPDGLGRPGPDSGLSR